MKPLIVGLLTATSLTAGTGLSAVQRPQTYTGTITDSECGADGHAIMRMGPTDGECARMCVVSHGASYVLLDGKTVYALSDQATPETFAGRRVRVVGTLNPRTRAIQVESISAVD